MKAKTFEFIKYLQVLFWSLWFGGLIYEMVVIFPLWSGNPPTSVIEWNSRPEYIVNPTQFHAPVAVLTILFSLIVMVLNWRSKTRSLALVSALSAIATLAVTIIYFFPRNIIIFQGMNQGLSPEQITNVVSEWTNANYVRMILMLVGYFYSLKSLRQA